MMSAELKIVDGESLNLVVGNVGVSIARDVALDFDPPLPDGQVSRDGQGNPAQFINERYARPISVWVPGREMENHYWIRDDDSPDDAPVSIDDVPNYVVVTITYIDDVGRQYRDTFPLDVREFNGEALPSKIETRTATRVVGAKSGS